MEDKQTAIEELFRRIRTLMLDEFSAKELMEAIEEWWDEFLEDG